MSDTTTIDKSAKAVSAVLENADIDYVDIKYGEVDGVIEGLGVLDRVDYHGGEGEGDEYWVVFSVRFLDGDVRLYRVNGYYASYDGGYLDGDLYEVTAKQRLVTFYE